MSRVTSGPPQNYLLAALPYVEYQRLLPHLEETDMQLGQVLYESGESLTHAYFPTTSIVSLLYVTEKRTAVEIAVVGFEGLVGIALFMGGGHTPSRAMVQTAGQGFRLKANVVKAEFAHGGPIMHLMLRYTQALITQMSHVTGCSRHHTVEQQLCRWLLSNLDRTHNAELVMTQELIANMLTKRREDITDAALRLQQAGLICCTRGRISIFNRPGLEKRACECYAVVKKEYDRLLPGNISPQ